jgi:hypothetical protein
MSRELLTALSLVPTTKTFDSLVNTKREFFSARERPWLFGGLAAVYKNHVFFQASNDLGILHGCGKHTSL